MKTYLTVMIISIPTLFLFVIVFFVLVRKIWTLWFSKNINDLITLSNMIHIECVF